MTPAKRGLLVNCVFLYRTQLYSRNLSPHTYTPTHSVCVCVSLIVFRRSGSVRALPLFSDVECGKCVKYKSIFFFFFFSCLKWFNSFWQCVISLNCRWNVSKCPPSATTWRALTPNTILQCHKRSGCDSRRPVVISSAQLIITLLVLTMLC